MVYEVEVTEEFRVWYQEVLCATEQENVARAVAMLEQAGPALPFPYSSGIQGSRFGHMRELRIQHEGRPYRVLYAFDTHRAARCWSAATRPETIAGTTAWFQRQTLCTSVT